MEPSGWQALNYNNDNNYHNSLSVVNYNTTISSYPLFVFRSNHLPTRIE